MGVAATAGLLALNGHFYTGGRVTNSIKAAKTRVAAGRANLCVIDMASE